MHSDSNIHISEHFFLGCYKCEIHDILYVCETFHLLYQVGCNMSPVMEQEFLLSKEITQFSVFFFHFRVNTDFFKTMTSG